jgi:uncharacterized membrane protein YhdT
MKQRPTKQEIRNVAGCLTKAGQIAVWIVATFIILKITGVITWSWWWILSPIWIPTGISLIAWITTEIVRILKK